MPLPRGHQQSHVPLVTQTMLNAVDDGDDHDHDDGHHDGEIKPSRRPTARKTPPHASPIMPTTKPPSRVALSIV